MFKHEQNRKLKSLGFLVKHPLIEEAGDLQQRESFIGPQKMEEKNEQMYLGDVISADGKH